MIFRNRVPYQYFTTKGSGTSKYEIHAGSYHIALYNAGISDYNIQTYSSILPKDSIEIKSNEIFLPFGSELYTIMSCVHGKQNEHISCGIITGELHDKDNNKIGGLVCEVSGNYENDEKLIKQLTNTINDLHIRTYKQYTISNFKTLTNQLNVEDKFGTCLVAMCFVTFQEN